VLRPGVEKRYPGLAPLNAEVREDVARNATRRVLPRGTLIFTEETPCVGFPLVLRGSIRVFKVSATGRELPLYRVGPGESCIISTVCLIGKIAYEARAEAETETEVAVLTPAQFSRLLGDASFQRFVFALFSRRLSDLMILVDALAFKRLDQRLALLLATGPRTRRVTHQAIADELGTVREIASRLLKEFERAGLLRLGRGRIEVLDADGLRRWEGSLD
jgi:CRP/FNR family transcriptional regulator